jgi:plasmid stabilization system protein ParE
MAFRVEIQPQAFEDLDSIAGYIKTRSSFRAAEKWFNGMMDDIASLKEMPERCAVAPESEELESEVRILLHGRRNRTYKIYFSIDRKNKTEGVVSVFHIRHWARKPLIDEDLEALTDDQQEDANGESGG